MSEYKQQAQRLRGLGRLPGPSLNGGPNFSTTSPSQAEHHRPPQLVHTLVQRHFFPAEGTVPDGVGQPVEETGCSPAKDSRVSDYQRLVRRRAAQTSKAIKAEKDARLQLVQAKRDRLQAARDYGVRVALGKPRALPRDASGCQASQSPRAAKGCSSATGSPSTATAPCDTQPVSAAPQDAALDTAVHEQGAYCVSASLRQANAAKDRIEPEYRTQAPVQLRGADGEDSPTVAPAQDSATKSAVTVKPVVRPAASLTARQRLMSYSTAEPGPGVAPQSAGGGLWTQGRDDAILSTHVKGFKARVLQPANASAPAPKTFKGKPLPLAVSLKDEIGLMLIAQKVAELGDKLSLPRLCGCPNRSSLFDPNYVSKCARNCPLYMQPERHEALLTGLLRAKDVI